MTLRATTVLLVGIVLAGISAATWLLLRGEVDRVSRDAAETSSGEAAIPESVAKARLTGAPVEREEAALEELVAQLAYEGDDAEARREIAARAATQEEIVTKLVALLDLSYSELKELGLYRHQILEALVAIGRPAAAPVARALYTPSRYGWHYDLLAVLERMGGDAAPAVAVMLENWSKAPQFQPRLISVFRAVGSDASDALPILYEALSPPVDDRLAPTAGAAALAITGGDEAAVAAVRSALLDEETLARPAVLHQIGSHPTGAAALVPLLVDLLYDPERPTQAAAAFALGRIGVANRKVLLGLVTLLADGTARGQRRAAEALSALGEEGASVLAEVTREAVDVDDRLAAFTGLIRTGADAVPHVDVLLGILDEDVERDWKVRALAVLGSMNPLPEPEVVLPHLVRALADARLAAAALGVLCRFPGEEARAAIRAHLEATEDAQAAMTVIEGLSRRRVEEPAATAMLLEIARRENDAEMLTRAFLSLSVANPKADAATALSLIETHLDAEGQGLRYAAWRALVSLEGEDERVFAHCLRVLSEGGRYESAVASQALVQRSERASESVPVLIDRIARIANQSGWGDPVLIDALRRLAPKWAGTAKALDAAIDSADDRGRRVLADVRRRYGL